MTQAARTILETLLKLSDSDRGELAACLMESLDSPPETGAATEWEQEIQARIEQARMGQVKPVPWAIAREQITEESDGEM